MEYKDNFHDMIARYNRELLEAYHRRSAAGDAPQPALETVEEAHEATLPSQEDPTPLPPEIGVLQVWVTTASAALPLAGAQVTVSEGDTIWYSGKTDESGRSEAVSLPAANAQGSLSPAGQPTPFTLYDITVQKQGFYRVENRGVPLYGGVQAVQPVRLIPLPEGTFEGTLLYHDSAPTELEGGV